MPTQSGITSRIAALVVAGGLVLAALSGCAVRDEVPVEPNLSQPTPPSNPSITPTVPAGGTPVSIGCTSLLTIQAVYDYNPNYGIQNGFSPAAGTPAAEAVRAGGVACNLYNQTSGDTITVAVAKPGTTALAAQKARAGKGASQPGLGDAAYFMKTGSTGQIDVFRGEYWMVVTSTTFLEAADARPIVAEALKHIS